MLKIALLTCLKAHNWQYYVVAIIQIINLSTFSLMKK